MRQCFHRTERSANLARAAKRLISQLRATQSHSIIPGIYSSLRILTSVSVPDAIRASHAAAYALPLSEPVLTPCSSIPPFNVADILSLAIDHLKVAWITADLGIHVDILALIGQLFRDGSSALFRPFVQQLLSHVLRVLNICCFIIRGELPPNYSKTSKVFRSLRALSWHSCKTAG